METVIIYTLTMNRLNKFYVGSTANMKLRLMSHKTSLTIGGTKKSRNGYIIEEIDTVPASDRFYWERFYIEQMKQWGFALFNTRAVNPDSNQYKKGEMIRIPFPIAQLFYSLKKRGDVAKIIRDTGFNRLEVMNALSIGKGEYKLFEYLTAFYDSRSPQVRKTIKKYAE